MPDAYHGSCQQKDIPRRSNVALDDLPTIIVQQALKIDRLEAENAKLRAENAKLKREYAELETENDTPAKLLEDAEADKVFLNQRLELRHIEIERLKKEIEELRAENANNGYGSEEGAGSGGRK